MSEKAPDNNSSYSELRTYDWNPELGLYTRAHRLVIPPNQGVIFSRGRHPEITEEGWFLAIHDARKKRNQYKFGAYHSKDLKAVSVFSEDGVMTAFAVGRNPGDYPANGTHEIKDETRELVFVGIGIDQATALKQIGNWEETIPLQRKRSK